jgi:VanZ family protein
MSAGLADTGKQDTCHLRSANAASVQRDANLNCLHTSRVNPWIPAALAWTGVILLSSTSTAAVWSEEVFRWLSGLFLGRVLRAGSSLYGFIHLLADKGVHVTLFLVLSVSLWKIVPPGPRKIARILIIGGIVGSASEFLQSFFPGRDPAIRDIVINVAGTAFGIALVRLFSAPGCSEVETD